MRIKSALAVASAAGLALAGFVASPASAGLTTSCVGTAGAVTVPGDLFVPAGKSCTLEGTTVEGKVTVRAGADLVITDGDLQGAVVVAKDSYFDAFQTNITGNISTTGGYGVYLDESTVGGQFTGKATEDITPFLYVGGSEIGSNVKITGGETLIDSSSVGRDVTAADGSYLDVVNSTVFRNLTVSNQTDGAVVCGSEVDGAASFTGSAGVQVGTGDALSTCDDVNYFGGDVTVSNNTVGSWVSGNIVRGDLAGEGNDPAPTGSDNRVRGESTGQFADLEASASASTSKAARSARTARSAAPAPEAGKAEVMKKKGLERKADAEAAAEKAGPAKL